MHIAWQGAFTGLAIALVLIAAEYIFVKKAVQERATMRHQKPEFEDTDRNRIKAVAKLAVFFPLGGALLFWLVWG